MSKEVFEGWVEVKNKAGKIVRYEVKRIGKRTKVGEDLMPLGQTLEFYINSYCGEEFIRFIPV